MTIKINFSKKISNPFSHDLTYAIVGKDKYVAIITKWDDAPTIMNIRTGLVIGYLAEKGNCFKRAWGFRKDLGKNGRVLKSATKNKMKKKFKKMFDK